MGFLNSRLGFGCLLLLAMSGARAAAAENRFSFERAEMGVPFQITLYAANEPEARAAAEAVFTRIGELNSVLSDYDPDSELSRLSRSSGSGMAVPVSGELWTVLEQAQTLAERSQGAFDVTIGPLVNVWRRARRKQELPSRKLLGEMRARVGFRHLLLNATARTAELNVPDMRLDVGGIAKGYAVDQGLALLQARGFQRALVAASGDIALGDPPPGQSGWKIELAGPEAPGAPPRQVVYLKNRAISTSGDSFQFVEIDGVRYSHIVDPQTGLGLQDSSLVTVIARNGITADGLATAVSVLGPEKGRLLVEQTPGAFCRIAHLKQGKTEFYESKGWQEEKAQSGKLKAETDDKAEP